MTRPPSAPDVRRHPVSVALVVAVAAVSAVWPPASIAQQDLDSAKVFFGDNCARCHTIGGGRLTGPDLKDVQQRQPREWLIGFVLDPQGRIDAGDPYAVQLFESARGVVMPQVAGLDPELAQALLALIEQESALESSEFSTPQVPSDPFTESDRMIGRLLFTGKAPLRSGAPPCSGCHDLAGLGGWGGGRMAPDLSRVWERLGGRAAVADWLQSPQANEAVPVPVAVAHRPMETSEIPPLSAVLEAAARSGRTHPARAQLLFSAAAWAVAALVLCLVAWLTARTTQTAQTARTATVDWAVPSLLLGLAVVAVFHLLPLLLPGTVLDLAQRPRTLWGLETAHLAAGLLALCGLMALRRTADAAGHKIFEIGFLALLGLAACFGVVTALVHRWGLAWLAGWLTPSLGALLRGDADATTVVDGLPLLVLLHVGTGLVALCLLPFTRWRRLLDPRRLDPRRLDLRRLDPRRLLPGRRGKRAEDHMEESV